MSLNATVSSPNSSRDGTGSVDVVVAGADLLRTGLEPADRAHEQPRQQHRRETDHEDDHRRGQHQLAGERRDGGERLRGVDLGDHRPVQPGHVDRRVRLQRLVAEIVVGRSACPAGPAGPAWSPRWRPAAPGWCRPAGSPPRPRRAVCPPRRRRACKLSRVLEEQPRVRAHQVVGSDDERLAGLAHARLFPAPVHRHQPVDLGDRKLQREHAVDAALAARPATPSRRSVRRRAGSRRSR